MDCDKEKCMQTIFVMAMSQTNPTRNVWKNVHTIKGKECYWTVFRILFIISFSYYCCYIQLCFNFNI